LLWIAERLRLGLGLWELFRSNANIDWLGKKWYFLGFSLIFSVAGVLSMLFWHHIPLGVDFKGGTQITVQVRPTPNEDHIRQAMDAAHMSRMRRSAHQRCQRQAGNEGIISLPESTAQDRA
jgi:preprotein translocase subunit SecF